RPRATRHPADRATRLSRPAGKNNRPPREAAPVAADCPQYRLTHEVRRVREAVDEIRSLIARRKDFNPIAIRPRVASREELSDLGLPRLVQLQRREKRLLRVIREQFLKGGIAGVGGHYNRDSVNNRVAGALAAQDAGKDLIAAPPQTRPFVGGERASAVRTLQNFQQVQAHTSTLFMSQCFSFSISHLIVVIGHWRNRLRQ